MTIMASILVFAAVLLFALWFSRRQNAMQNRVRSLAAARRTSSSGGGESFGARVIMPAVRAFGTRATAIMPTTLVAQARRWLIISNSSMGLPTFMSLVLVLATAPALITFATLYASGGGSLGTMQTLLVIAVAVTGIVGPMMILRRAAKNRQNAFWKALPDSLDLLTTCVEAGLSLDFAFQRVAARQKGPVGEEIGRMLREKALGQPRREALLAMAERIALPDVNVFVNSVIQAETLGTSIGQVLRVQSRQLRIRRRQRAEQMARQAAPKMVFPLVFFIMPNLFIVILGPIIINAIKTFTG
ncbi:MAG TPA: type II secretion system F family protein [Dehalococcoidia bacterium]|nr:type II secretion system F family protein [Dehalococcoidia bacterium]